MYGDYRNRKKILALATEIIELAYSIERRLALVGDWKDEEEENPQIDKIDQLLSEIKKVVTNDYS